MVTKLQSFFWKTVLLRISVHKTTRIIVDLKEEHKILGPIRQVRFTKATQRRADIGKKKQKDRRSEKNKFKCFISTVPSPWNVRTGLWTRLKDRSDVPGETRDDWPRISQIFFWKKKKTEKANESCLPTTSAIKLEDNICCRFQSIHAHVEQERPELCRIGNRKRLKKSDDGCYSQRRSACGKRSHRVCSRIGCTRDSKAWRSHTGCSSRKTLPRSLVFYSYEWATGQKPQFIKGGRRIKCSTTNDVPVIVLDLLTDISSSVTPTSPTSVSQEAEHPASTRSESSRSPVWWSPSHDSAEIGKKLKSRHRERTGQPVAWFSRMLPRIYGKSGRSTLSSPLWAHESASEPRGNVVSVSGKYDMCAHFPKNKDCQICKLPRLRRSLQKMHWHSCTSSKKNVATW